MITMVQQALSMIPQWQWATMPWLIIAVAFAVQYGGADE
jgi:hypothetical protein